ncbi:MAG TPA: RNA-binding protein [Candidatus Acidoferrales bacterium]
MKKLYVGNLPFQASETELQELFTNAGISVTTITLVRDRQTGDPRGFGFVEIASDEEAERAIQSLNGQELLGRRLVVNEARPPRERGFGGGRGGGGGGYGRGGGGGGGGGGYGRGGGGGRGRGGGRDRF